MMATISIGTMGFAASHVTGWAGGEHLRQWLRPGDGLRRHFVARYVVNDRAVITPPMTTTISVGTMEFAARSQ
jgi:hypothetical protein